MDFAKFFNKRFVQVVKEKKKIMFEHGMTLTTQTPCLRSLRLRGQNSKFSGIQQHCYQTKQPCESEIFAKQFYPVFRGPR